MRVGTEWIVDAAGCDPERLRDGRALRNLCDAIVAELGLHVLGEPRVHVFPGAGGVTTMYLLTESHLTCHTYPEHGTATFNLYCCRQRPRWPWEARLREHLDAATVVVRVAERGLREEKKDARQIVRKRRAR